MKVLVLGGYGHFGGRIARALARERTIELIIGGRDARRAEAFAATLRDGVRGVAIDAQAPALDRRLRALGAELVIHTAGPFQQQDYGVALACAAAGAHYIDLADGRRFVCDFAAHTDAAFRAAGRSGVSGASTVPALSSAIVDHLTSGWTQIDAIGNCIAPAQGAPRGVATMGAVLGYCGEPIAVWRDGRWQVEHGWSEPRPVTFARMRPRLGACCDIPDLELFPQRYGGVREVTFRAALEVRASQRALALLAALRRRRWIASPARWTAALHRLATVFDRFGSALGGMVVRVSGLDAAGRATARAWHIAADHHRGPEIPCMAAIVLARQLARGEEIAIGAQPCVGLLRLADFEPEFARWQMQIDVLDDGAAAA